MKNRKSNIRQICMSIVALLVIMVVGAGVAYSWIEGGTTYTMETDSPVSAGAVPWNAELEGTVTLDPSTSSTIYLLDYDTTTSQYLDISFSPVSSLDGKSFFVPSQYASNGTVSGYREANTNDIGTKFVQFDFDIKTAKKCYLAFNVAPSITVKKSGVTVTNADTSPFRIMVSNGTKSYIFSTSDAVQSNAAVTNVSGTTSTLTTDLITPYLNNAETTKNRLFSYNANETDNIQVAVWLDSNAPASKISPLLGSNVTIDLQLIVAEPMCFVTYDARTYNSAGEEDTTNNFAGGSIQVGTSSTKYTTSGTVKVVEDGTITLKAVPNTNYEFKGWFTDASCSEESKVGALANLPNQPVTKDITYYAKFQEKPKYTINVVADPAEGGSVTAGGSGTSYTDYKGKTVELKATANSGYGFVGWYDGDTLVSENATYTVTLSASKTYTAKFQESRATTIYVEKRSGFGTYSVYAYQASKLYTAAWPGTAATLDNDTGFYKLEFDTADTGNFNVIISNNGSDQYPGQFEDGLEGALGGTYIFTADNKFEEFDPAKMVTFNVSALTGGDVKVSGVTSALTDKTSLKIRSGDEVTITATPSSGYEFVGWYTNPGATSTIGSTFDTASQTIAVTGTEGGSVTYYAKFKVSTTYTYYFVVKSAWNSNTIQYNNKYKSGTHTDYWEYADMTDTGYTYNGNKIWSATFNNDDVFYNVAFKIMNGGTQTAYQEAYAGGDGMGKSSLNGKMYVADTGQWINYTHD